MNGARPRASFDLIDKIVTGGQTGADRAALDFALSHGIDHGGWCPRGRQAEDGVIPARYDLKETSGSDPAQRTEWNVRDSDGTVILSLAPALSGGSLRTLELAEQYRKPCLHLSRERDGAAAARMLSHFLAKHQIRILNVAGPRQSEGPEIAAFTLAILEQAGLGARDS